MPIQLSAFFNSIPTFNSKFLPSTMNQMNEISLNVINIRTRKLQDFVSNPILIKSIIFKTQQMHVEIKRRN